MIVTTPHHPMSVPPGVPLHQTPPNSAVIPPPISARDSSFTRSTLGTSTMDRHSVKDGGSRVITPPATPGKIGGKVMNVRVQMLDDQIHLFQIQVFCLYNSNFSSTNALVLLTLVLI